MAFVGRESELQLLESRLEAASAGRGAAVFLSGDPGAGKSSLVGAFLERALTRHADLRVIRADCSEQFGAGEPYQPFVEAFRALLRGDERIGPRSVRELAAELAPYWLAAIPVAGDLIAATVTTASELHRSFGAAGAAAAAPSEEALFFQYTELFFAAAAHQPTLLFIDDLHWADRATIALLTHIVRRIGSERVLVLGTYRASDAALAGHPVREARLELERYKLAEEIALRPLTRESLAEFVRQELGGAPRPELVGWLERHAGANPLFFGELLRWLVDSGCAERREGEWLLARLPEDIEVPRSAASTIEKRLGRLDPEPYRILEYASIAGDEFDSTTLALLLDMDELALEETIEPLVRNHGLVRLADTRDLPNGEPASIYEFSHSLVREVLQKNLVGKRRILLHRKLAQILERIWAADADAIAHRLAVHYDEGRQPERALPFALAAADRARRLYAHWDALELLARALRNAQEPGARADVLERLGESNHAIGRYPEALAAFTEGVEAALSIGDRPRSLPLRRKLLLAERDHGARPAPELLASGEALLADAQAVGATREVCETLWLKIDLPGTGEQLDVQLAEEALRLAGPDGDAALLARAHYFVGVARMRAGDAEPALHHLQLAHDGYVELDEVERAGRCRNAIAVVHAMAGRYHDAAAALDAAAAAFDKVGNPTAAAAVRANLGVLLTRVGEWDRAGETLRESIRIFRRIDATARLLPPLQALAEYHQARADWAAAETTWRDLGELASSTGFWNARVIAGCGVAIARLERGDLEGARAQADVTRALLPPGGGWSDAREALHLMEARLATADGAPDRALAHLDEAEPQLAARDPYVWAAFRMLRARILAGRDPEAARAALEDAERTFDSLGAAPMLRYAREALGRSSGP